MKRIQRAIANTIVGQMLPAGVVKGGTAVKARVGEQASRFTPDLDGSRGRSLPLGDYLDARRGTPWPPTVCAYEGWDTIYASAADGLDVLRDLHAAVQWANGFIARAIRAGAA